MNNPEKQILELCFLVIGSEKLPIELIVVELELEPRTT